jgi:hypothetical protein
MANREASSSSTVLNPTRQQLDDLDSLLQQMLGLPVEASVDADLIRSDEARALDGSHPRHDANTFAPSSEKPVAEMAFTPELPVAPPVPQPGAPSNDRTPAGGGTEGQTQLTSDARGSDGPSIAASGLTASASVEAVPNELASIEQLEERLRRKVQASQTPMESSGEKPAIRERGRPPVGWWLRPWVWCNEAFDWLTLPLGPVGRWLRGSSGRAVFGWMGLVLLAAALAWVLADLIRWIW